MTTETPDGENEGKGEENGARWRIGMRGRGGSAWPLRADHARVQAAFAASGLSRAEVARRMRSGPSMISQYLSGRTPMGVEASVKFAHAINVDPWEIMPDWPPHPACPEGAGEEHRLLARAVLRAGVRDLVSEPEARALRVWIERVLRGEPGEPGPGA